MEYKGKLYGKAGEVVFPLLHTTDDWEAMEKKIAELEAQIKSQKSAIPIVRLSSLTDDWFNKQVEYERIASEKEDARHAARFNGKSQATRDCWKDLQRIIEDEA